MSENLSMTGQEMYKINSCFERDDFLLVVFSLRLIAYLGGHKRNSME